MCFSLKSKPVTLWNGVGGNVVIYVHGLYPLDCVAMWNITVHLEHPRDCTPSDVVRVHMYVHNHVRAYICVRTLLSTVLVRHSCSTILCCPELTFL